MRECECPYLPEKYHYVYYGITEPGSMQEYNPYCPEHGELPREEPGMTDIISRAKELLKDTTPGPWIAADSDIISPDNGFIGTISEYSGLVDGSEEQANAKLAAAAPKMAQALVEETWEYGVEYTGINHGNRHIQWCYGVCDETSFEEAQWEYEKMLKRDMNPRIVRRRVSPLEVIE